LQWRVARTVRSRELPIARAGNDAGARYAQIPLREASEPGLTATDHKVLLVIAWHANKKWLAWPSLRTIATLARTTEHKVTVSTKKLEAKGLLQSIGGLPSMAGPTSMKSSPATRNHLPNRRISLPLPTTWKGRH
jgi:hypothetical protein